MRHFTSDKMYLLDPIENNNWIVIRAFVVAILSCRVWLDTHIMTCTLERLNAWQLDSFDLSAGLALFGQFQNYMCF